MVNTGNRVTSRMRHKVDRRIRERRRDIRKAAKDMKKAGLKVRSNKQREDAKKVLRVSNANPDKAQFLKSLLSARERARGVRSAKRAASKGAAKEGGAVATKADAKAEAAALAGALATERARRANKRGRVAEEDEEEEEEEDADEEGLEEGEDDADEEAEETRGAGTKRRSEQRQVFIPNAIGANYVEQFRAYVLEAALPAAGAKAAAEAAGADPAEAAAAVAAGVARAALPSAFLVVCDARCAVQSVPWPEVDFIVAAAAVEANADAAKAARGGNKRASGNKAAASAAPRVFAKPLVLFALAKADLVSAPVLAAQAKLLSDALAQRYAPGGDVAVDFAVPATPAASNGAKKGAAKPADTAAAVSPASFPVEFAFGAFSSSFDATGRALLKTLRNYCARYWARPCFGAATDAEAGSAGAAYSAASHNLQRKMAVLVLGAPNVGKSAVLRGLHVAGTASAVTVVPCRGLSLAAPEAAPPALLAALGGEDAAPVPWRRLLFTQPKQFTFVTLSDDVALRRQPILSGDAIFHAVARIDKEQEPDAAGVLLVESIADRCGLAQNFSCPYDPSTEANPTEAAAGLIKRLGRVVLRERGFTPSVFVGASATEASHGSLMRPGLLAASSVRANTSASFAGRRIVRVHTKRGDGRNALRVGARVLLREFSTGAHFPWAVTSPEAGARAASLSDYPFPCVFTDFSAQVPTEAATEGSDNASTFAPVAGALQRLLSPYLILLPKFVVEVKPEAVVLTGHDFSGQPDEDEEEEDEEEEDADDDEEEELEEEEGDDEEDSDDE